MVKGWTQNNQSVYCWYQHVNWSLNGDLSSSEPRSDFWSCKHICTVPCSLLQCISALWPYIYLVLESVVSYNFPIMPMSIFVPVPAYNSPPKFPLYVVYYIGPSIFTSNWHTYNYCIQTLTRHSWIHYTDCWIVK